MTWEIKIGEQESYVSNNKDYIKIYIQKKLINKTYNFIETGIM